MDYSGGTHLAKWQWDVMFDPALLVNPFEDDEAGMSRTSDDDTKKLYQILYGTGTDAFVFCKKCETGTQVSGGEFKFTIKGKSYKCAYAKMSVNGTVEAIYPKLPANIDESVTIADITTGAEQFIILSKKNNTVQYCEAKEKYDDYCSLEKPFENTSFNQKILKDLAKCSNLPDVSTYKAKSTFTASSEFDRIREAVQEKLNNSFYGNVKLCVELSSSNNDFARLTTAGIDCASAEIKLGIHIDYANNQVLMKLDANDNYLQEYVNNWNSKVQKYQQYWETSINVNELRLQVISDLEEPVVVQSFFEKLIDRLDAMLSDKIAGVVEGVLASQKIAKNVWAEGEINRSTWHSSESEHKEWPQYAQFQPIIGGTADGFIDQITGIPMAIKGIYGIMTDGEQRKALAAMFTKEGVSQLISSLKSEAEAMLHDGEMVQHAASKTVVGVATMLVPGMQIGKAGKLAEAAEKAADGMVVFKRVKELHKKIDDIISNSTGAIKKQMKEFFETINHSALDKLMDVNGFDDVLFEMAQHRNKFKGGKFVMKYCDDKGDDFIKGIKRFESPVELDLGDGITKLRKYDIEMINGRKLEFKDWSAWQSWSNASFRKQFIPDLADGNFIELGQKKYIFASNNNINRATLKQHVINSLKKADGSPIDDLNIISESQVKKLVGDYVNDINGMNKSQKIIEALNNDNVFYKLFEIVE
jgi:hypothetical protein